MEIGFLDAVPAGMLMLPMQIGVGNAWRLGAADHHALSFLKEQVPEPFAYLMAVGVDPALRGQGEGKRIIADVEKAAAAANHHTLTLKTENPNNVPLYEHLGFVLRGHAVMPWSKIPTWVMSKSID